MQLLLILAIAAAATASDGAPSEPVAAAGLRLLLAACGTAFVSAYALAISRATVQALRRDYRQRRKWLQRFRRWQAMHTALWLVATGGLLYGLGWSQLVRCNWRLQDSFLADDLLTLLPVVLPVLVAWAAYHRVECFAAERAKHVSGATASPLSSGGVVGLQARCHILLILVPVFGLLAIQDGVRLAAPGFAAGPHADLALLPALALLLVCFPFLLKHVWRAVPLPRGTLRDALQADSLQWRSAARDVLVWPTGHRVVAAAVTGLVPAARFVVLSDALVCRLADEEVRAVVAHEAGHIRHRHLWLRTMAVVGPLVLLFSAARLVSWSTWTWTPWGTSPGFDPRCLFALPTLVAVGAYALLVFGPYCRILERQADLFACRGLHADGAAPVDPESMMTVSGTARFIAALERLSASGGGHRSTSSWLHPSTAERVEFLQALVDQPRAQERFLRTMRHLELLVAGGSLGSLACLLMLL